MFGAGGGGGLFGAGGGNGKPDLSVPAPAANSEPSGGGGYSGSGFDPTGLERAAKAAKELDGSRNAKYAFELAKHTEQTKQSEQKAKMKEYEAQARQYELGVVEKKGHEERKTLQQKNEQSKQIADYKDTLDRKRIKDKLEAEVYMRKQEREAEQANMEKIEAIKRKTLEHEAALRQKTEQARVLAEAEGRIRQEQENRKIHMEKAVLEAKEYRDTVLQGIKLSGETIGSGIKEFLGDTERLTTTVGGITMLALGIYAAKTGTGVAGRFIEARLGKPSLVRDTSRVTGMANLNPVPVVQRLMNTPADAMKGIILEESLAARAQSISTSTANTKKNNAPYRNILLYGPPGTGKTLYAKGLAQHSGLDYAIMTGGDVAPLGREGVTELHKMFDWAETSSRGVLLFVDEAEAFLQKRSKAQMSEDVRNALNAFLYRTGTQSSKFMVVFASNQPEQFDWAINDRIDEMVEFTLPGEEERFAMIQQYVEEFIVGGGKGWRASKIQLQSDVDEAKLLEVAKATDGFSGREISKLVIGWQAAAYGMSSAVLNADVVDAVLNYHIAQSQQKQAWHRDGDVEGDGDGEAAVFEAKVVEK